MSHNNNHTNHDDNTYSNIVLIVARIALILVVIIIITIIIQVLVISVIAIITVSTMSNKDNDGNQNNPKTISIVVGDGWNDVSMHVWMKDGRARRCYSLLKSLLGKHALVHLLEAGMGFRCISMLGSGCCVSRSVPPDRD